MSNTKQSTTASSITTTSSIKKLIYEPIGKNCNPGDFVPVSRAMRAYPELTPIDVLVYAELKNLAKISETKDIVPLKFTDTYLGQILHVSAMTIHRSILHQEEYGILQRIPITSNQREIKILRDFTQPQPEQLEYEEAKKLEEELENIEF